MRQCLCAALLASYTGLRRKGFAEPPHCSGQRQVLKGTHHEYLDGAQALCCKNEAWPPLSAGPTGKDTHGAVCWDELGNSLQFLNIFSPTWYRRDFFNSLKRSESPGGNPNPQMCMCLLDPALSPKDHPKCQPPSKMEITHTNLCVRQYTMC